METEQEVEKVEKENDAAGSDSLNFVRTFVGVRDKLAWAGVTPGVKETFRSKFGVD